MVLLVTNQVLVRFPPQRSRPGSTAPTRSWRPSPAPSPWSGSSTTWASSRRTPGSPRRRRARRYGPTRRPPGSVPEQNLTICFFRPQLETYEVSVAPELQQQLAAVVQDLGVHIPPPVSPLTVRFHLRDRIGSEPERENNHLILNPNFIHKTQLMPLLANQCGSFQLSYHELVY